MKHSLKITPAIEPGERHQIEDCLKEMGYHVIGGGTDTDMSECGISFEHDYPAYRQLQAVGTKG